MWLRMIIYDTVNWCMAIYSSEFRSCVRVEVAVLGFPS